MNDLAVLPTPCKVFRSLLTATGYRPCLEGKGLGRDVDHLALEERPAGNVDLLENCQAQWLRAIRDDAGADWSNLAESAWNRHSNLLCSMRIISAARAGSGRSLPGRCPATAPTACRPDGEWRSGWPGRPYWG